MSAALLTTLTTVTGFSGTSAQGAERSTDAGTRHDPSRPAAANGQAAIDLLGDRIDEAAAFNGWSTKELKHELREDESLWLRTDGRAYYVEPASDGKGVSIGEGVAPFPLSQTFQLHSRPGSTKKIFLDFDGSTVSGTSWNESPQNLPNGFYSGYSLDGSATFNDTEKEEIQKVWQRVAEDYATLDIDVTTEDPGLAAIDRADASDNSYGTRALITNSPVAVQTLCPEGCGGLAFVGAFDMEPSKGATHASLQPAWVFAPNLANSDTKAIAEATSHEVGHNLGLNHDGKGAEDYYSGHNMWAPIMGIGYDKPLVQWSKGEYTGATNTEDDLTVIASHGVVPLADDGAATVAAAANMPARAVIGNRQDVDVFSLGTCSGAMSVSATGATPSSNLDIKLDLLNADGTVVASDNPASAFVDENTITGLNASINRTVAAGTYYVRVDGVGNGTADTGYTDYASIGAYNLAKSGCGAATVPGAPTLTGTTVNNGAIVVAFNPPASNGGSAIIDYYAQCVSSDGGVTVAKLGNSSPLSATGATGGKSYRCRVQAKNAAGWSAYTAFGGTVSVSTTVPGTPTLTGTSVSNGAIVVAFNAPASNGGSAITQYYAQCVSSDGGVTVAKLGTSSPLSATGATGGKSYRCRVQAKNAVGWGAYTGFGTTVVVSATAPGSPALTSTTPGEGEATVAFTAPASNGGSAITQYYAQCVSSDGGVTAGRFGTSSPVTVLGLTSEATYRCRVQARNAVGWGVYSAFGSTITVD